MANIPQPIFNGFPDQIRSVTRNCSLKALTQPEYGFMQVGCGKHPGIPCHDNDLMGTFPVFQTCRIDQEANEAYYVPDTVNDGTLEATMAGNFARQAIQNFKEHLRGLQQHIAILWQAALEPRLNRMEAKRASTQLARAIVYHDPQPPADLLNLDIAEDYHVTAGDWEITSDGVKAHLLFEKPILLQIEPIVTTRAEIRRLPENLDVTAWTKGVYHLDKGPRGLNEARIENSRIVGLDPGVSSMIAATSTQDEMPQPGLWQQEVTRNSSNVSAAADFEQHIRVMSRVRNRLFSHRSGSMRFFNAHFKHREIRATLASARQSANHHIMNQLLGLTPPFHPGTKMHHTRLSSKRMRKRWHRHRSQAARELSGRPIGKAAFLRMKRKRVQTRIRHTRGRKVKTCVNMDGQRLHRQSLCTQGQQQGGPS
ncbi:hypothetical protein BJV82DRAFT_656595 [Fennellomyces sp. T-0311]|nr:hypothetical protein BJV82DRAFT_656595 [Fennellomyces sp. T-0311]